MTLLKYLTRPILSNNGKVHFLPSVAKQEMGETGIGETGIHHYLTLHFWIVDVWLEV
jgi:hypothetical protein